MNMNSKHATEKPKILVIGDVMLDKYLIGTSSRISPEAPVPVVSKRADELKLGGAANVAANIRSLGGDCTLIGIYGDDAHGDELSNLLQLHAIKDESLRLRGDRTITKLRVMSNHQQLLRIDYETPFTQREAETGLPDMLAQVLLHDVVILSDYNKGTLHRAADIIQFATANQKPVLIDPKGKDYSKYKGATLLTPNVNELAEVTGTFNSEGELLEKASQLKAELELKALLVTRSEKGMSLLLDPNRVITIPALAKDVFDVTGAGDTVISALAIFLARGCSFEQASDIANKAASIAVSKHGTATVSSEELETLIYAEPTPLETLTASYFNPQKLFTMLSKVNAPVTVIHGQFSSINSRLKSLIKQLEAKQQLVVYMLTRDEHGQGCTLREGNRLIHWGMDATLITSIKSDALDGLKTNYSHFNFIHETEV